MEKKPFLTLPVAIVIGALLVGGAIIYTASNPSEILNAKLPTAPDPKEAAAVKAGLEKMLPISAADHVRGVRNAPVVIVEFSDTECPYCKRFHETMRQVMASFGEKGEVAWVYRHFPLVSLHPKAPKESEATECAAELGGEDIFWRYLDRLMEVTPANNGLDPAELPKIAEFVGLDKASFESCLQSGRHAPKVAAQVEDAINSGGKGTPYSVLIAPNGERFPISGAQPYETIKQAIDTALRLK